MALESPIDTLADKLFWAHMIQHLLLLVVAAPLIVLGRPWMSIWRPLPLGFRRDGRADGRALALARAAARGCSGRSRGPAGAWLAFNVNMVVWHLPGPTT